MTRYTAQTLYDLLPAVHRQRDQQQGSPLRDLFEILGEQAKVLEEEIQRLYGNWFIETCDDWVIPYLGDLLAVSPSPGTQVSRRAEVANTLGYRRRKGTLAVVEQVARDVTGWPARAVEYFTLLTTTQNLNHVRMEVHGTPDLRDVSRLSRLDGPFERTSHLLDVRGATAGGRYNIRNIGVHLWRLSAYEVHRAAAHPVDDGSGTHHCFSSLGSDIPLFRRPDDLSTPFLTATERNVADPIEPGVLHDALAELYGEDASLAVWEGEALIGPEAVAVCDLTDWAREVPSGRRVALDPRLGRMSFASEPAAEVRVRYHYGFSADVGGGPYDRSARLGAPGRGMLHVGTDPALDVPEGVQRFATLGEALDHWTSRPVDDRPDVIQIDDNSTYVEDLADIELPENGALTIRAANRRRPTLRLANEMHVDCGANTSLVLSGLLIGGDGIRATGRLRSLHVSDCTLVPGHGVTPQGLPLDPGAPSVRVDAVTAAVTVEHSIVGPIRTAVDAQVRISDSVLDAGAVSAAAFEGQEDGDAGGVLHIERSTVIGEMRAAEIRLASDTLFLGRIETVRRQQGCVRFSHVPLESVAPRRHRCQPAPPGGASAADLVRLASAARPRFTSLRYGDPGYCQLTPDAPDVIRRGAEDGSEMGAFSRLQQPQREDGLRLRLREYLKLGLDAGLHYAT
jgi:hypothetical protein